MAIFGAQILISVIVSCLIQKLGTKFSFGEWFLRRMHLKRYLHPTDAELRQLYGRNAGGGGKKSLVGFSSATSSSSSSSSSSSASTSSRKRNSRTAHNAEVVHANNNRPNSQLLVLRFANVSIHDFSRLKYFSDFLDVFDYSFYSLIIYLLTEVYSAKYPIDNQINLSMVWCIMIFLYAWKILISLTFEYFKNDESIGERSMCLVMGFAFLFVSMCILIISENILEFDLEIAYNTFQNNTNAFIRSYDLKSTGPASKFMLKYCLSLWCGFMGALFIFPGFRLAKIQTDLLKSSINRGIWWKSLLNLNFLLPFVIVVLWIKPVSRYYLSEKQYFQSKINLMNSDQFEIFRVAIIAITLVLRVVLLPWYLQAYLNFANERFDKMRNDLKNNTKIDIQKAIASIFYYICVVILQYLLPVIIILFCTLMYKTLSDFHWTHFVHGRTARFADNRNATLSDDFASTPIFKENLFYALKKIFGKEFFKGFFGFATWWLCFLWFTTSTIGLIYQRYFCFY